MSDLREIDTHTFPLLAEIPKPPPKLYMRGTLANTQFKYLAVVGARALSSYGKQACEFLIRGLKGYPIIIVSGLAYGADACAHRTALEAGLPTIAVPGSGLAYDVLYPRAHLSLAKEIIKAGGAHLSEFAPEEPATPYTFPKRNRIMAGMSHATLVIEAKEKSGSLITAKLATDFNRELMVVPGPIFSDTSKGNHQFLKLGATPVTEPEDILRALSLETTEKSTELPEDLSDNERLVMVMLSEPCPRDTVLQALPLPTHEANALLSMMEIKGLITEAFGALRRV